MFQTTPEDQARRIELSTLTQKLTRELWVMRDHAEDCAKHAHDECGPDETEPDGWLCSGGGLDREECEPRECECGLSRLREMADKIESLASLCVLADPATARAFVPTPDEK